MRRITYLITAFALASAASAQAQGSTGDSDWTFNDPAPTDWVQVSTASSGTIWLIRARDVATAPQTGTKRVWVQLDHSRDASVRHRRAIRLMDFMCGTSQAATITTTWYAPNGAVADTYTDRYARPDFVVPETVLESVYNAVCGIIG